MPSPAARVRLAGLALPLAVTALAGCGTTTGPADRSDTRLPGGGPRPLQAAYVFKAGDLKPGRVTIPATDEVLLVVSAADRRAHVVTVDVDGRAVEVSLRPSQTLRRRLTGLRAGATYRVVPDGDDAAASLLVVG